MSETTATATSDLSVPWLTRRNIIVVLAGAAALLAGHLYLSAEYGWHQGALFVVGGALGVTLYHAAFGFTGSWRNQILSGKGGGVRAQMIMLGLAVCLFFPALAAGSLFDRSVGGFVAPVGISVAFGAFVFGIGMQLGGGCGSGTLFTAGGGNLRMVVTLAFFVAGSLIGTAHMPFWTQTPNIGGVSLVRHLGLPTALAANLSIFALIFAVSYGIEWRRYGRPHLFGGPRPPQPGSSPLARLWRGPWPLVWGAVALALLNFATLWLAGRPWGITSAFALWGAKIADTAGLPVAEWAYWQARSGALEASVLRNVNSVMNFGIILGAFTAAGLAGRFAPSLRIGWGPLAAAIVGGLMMGYGARLAYGCNIGAFFSGISSGSLHGWLWLVTAFAGNIIGARLRPAFGMA